MELFTVVEGPKSFHEKLFETTMNIYGGCEYFLMHKSMSTLGDTELVVSAGMLWKVASAI